MVLKGQLALVTGAAQGIGKAISRALAAAGARVIMADISAGMARQAATELSEQGLDCLGDELDVTRRDAVDAFAARIGADRGPIAILVNNAGIGINMPLDDDQAPKVWDDTIAVNLTGVFNVSRAFLPALKETRGSIVNISSVVAFTSGFADAGYVASKGGVRALTQKMCRDLAPHGIRVNAVAPGYVETDLVRNVIKEGRLDVGPILARTPQRRLADPAEIAKAIHFLCSDEASYVNGHVFHVDGGFEADYGVPFFPPKP